MKPKIFLDPDRRVYSARFKELKEPGKRAPEYTLCSEEFMLFKATKQRGKVKRSAEERVNLSTDLYQAMLEKKRAERNEAKVESKTEAEKRTVSDAIELYRKRVLINQELGKITKY